MQVCFASTLGDKTVGMLKDMFEQLSEAAHKLDGNGEHVQAANVRNLAESFQAAHSTTDEAQNEDDTATYGSDANKVSFDAPRQGTDETDSNTVRFDNPQSTEVRVDAPESPGPDATHDTPNPGTGTGDATQGAAVNPGTGTGV
jgi:hypothetical protein